jgi:hypothetical protein
MSSPAAVRARATAGADRIALLVAALSCVAATAGETNVLVSRRARSDFALTADPGSPAWRRMKGVFAEKDRHGALVPHHRTEIRSRWTPGNLYLLFICPYEELFLKPDPSTGAETDKLWNWDVAEAFIGTDFDDIKRYKEFQVSPHGEWVDLAIDRGVKPPVHDVTWSSGYEVKARLDPRRRVWYGEMRIPMSALGLPAPSAGQEMRINLYRCQGPPEDRKYINWQTVESESFHTPEAFGRLRLRD